MKVEVEVAVQRYPTEDVHIKERKVLDEVSEFLRKRHVVHAQKECCDLSERKHHLSLGVEAPLQPLETFLQAAPAAPLATTVHGQQGDKQTKQQAHCDKRNGLRLEVLRKILVGALDAQVIDRTVVAHCTLVKPRERIDASPLLADSAQNTARAVRARQRTRIVINAAAVRARAFCEHG